MEHPDVWLDHYAGRAGANPDISICLGQCITKNDSKIVPVHFCNCVFARTDFQQIGLANTFFKAHLIRYIVSDSSDLTG
jgi:hypothetical protein